MKADLGLQKEIELDANVVRVALDQFEQAAANLGRTDVDIDLP